MILTVLMLGGVILGATTIAGTLLLYQLRATTDSANSAKAIFAADAGVQSALFDFYCADDSRCNLPGIFASSSFVNKSSVSVECYDASNATTSCGDPNAVSAVTVGTAGQSSRSFFLTFSTSTVP